MKFPRKRRSPIAFALLVIFILTTACTPRSLTNSIINEVPARLVTAESIPADNLDPNHLGTTNSPKGTVIQNLRVSYIDVGQGDSILIQIPNGKNVLIDSGENSTALRVTAYLRKQGVKRLDAVIWTHPHADHIGGADVVTKAFDIGQVYMPKITSNTITYRDLLASMREKNLKATVAKAGLTIDLGSGVNALLVAPNKTDYEEINDYSAVLRLTYGETSFLFTGDAQTTSEKEMLTSGYNLQAQVLKVGHHGSHSSTSGPFLAAVRPKYAVISVGKGNDYGHPHKDTLTRLAKAGVKVYRTDQSGTIIIESDGKNLTFTTLGVN